jgi:uncharacterized protein
MSELASKRRVLLELLGQFARCVVAYSGGVDSAVVAKAAHLVLGARAIAVTGVSDSLAAGELDRATETARQIGIRHQVLYTQEFSRPQYLRNAPDRCYHCKTELYERLKEWLQQVGLAGATIVNGANADDLGDYRPGMQAAAEHRVFSPLAECGMTKVQVRQLAAEWDLPVWDKPATPCLSSRVAYGLEVTPARLAMIDRAEQWLRNRGFPICRVRYLAGDVARVEVPLGEVPRLCDPALHEELVAHLLSLGFAQVSVDPAGFRSGSLNELIQINSAAGRRASQ